MKMLEKKGSWISLAVFIGLFIVAWIFTIKKDNEISSNRMFTAGEITECFSSRGNAELYYKYTVNQKSFTNSSVIPGRGKDAAIFVNKHFPVIYSALNPEKSEILIVPSDFERFDLLFPDSLKWVLAK